MSGTVRISQLASVPTLGSNDVIIVNVDGNSDTRTISFSEFTAALAPVKSVNTIQPTAAGEITINAGQVGAPTITEFNALDVRVAAAEQHAAINSGSIQTNATAIALGVSTHNNYVAEVTADFADVNAKFGATFTTSYSVSTCVAGIDSDIAALTAELNTVNTKIGVVDVNTGDLNSRVVLLETHSATKTELLNYAPKNGPFVGSLIGDVSGNVIGNVTGNVNGDVSGNTTGVHTGSVVGNVTGNITGNAATSDVSAAVTLTSIANILAVPAAAGMFGTNNNKVYISTTTSWVEIGG